MKLFLVAFLLMFSAPVFSQGSFDSWAKTTDSLNIFYFKQNRDAGEFDKNGLKTGHWTEYQLLVDSADRLIPVVVQGEDFRLDMEFPKPTILQKTEIFYYKGEADGKSQWFEADYNENKVTWKLSRETEFKKGKKHGHEVEYDVFGHVQRQAEYTNDMLNGIETVYWSKDVICYKIYWKENVVQTADFFYQGGQIMMRQKLTGNSLWAMTEYYESGKLKASYQASALGKEGEYRAYDEDGVLITTRFFKNGNEL